MRKIITTLVVLSNTIVLAQGRVGINTDAPAASLHIKRHEGISENSPQGLILPHLTLDQRNKFETAQLTKGLMIYNTTKNCIDWWDGTNWQCTDGTQKDNPNVPIPPVGSDGRANVWDRTHYIASMMHEGANASGDIDNSTDKITLEIPYNEATIGKSYAEINVVRQVQDYNGVTKTLTLNIPAGTFTKAKGFLTATIKVGNGSTDIYQSRRIAPNSEAEITSFSFSINGGTTANVRLIASGGIQDKRYGTWLDGAQKHNFVYVPVSVYTSESAIPNSGKPYEHTWLNNNLGAEYANESDPNGNYNPTKQAESRTDYKAYGSLFQWQRPSDGHQLMKWTGSTTGMWEYDNSGAHSLWHEVNWTPNHPYFYKYYSTDEPNQITWTTPYVNPQTAYHNLWQAGKANNPCPNGYHVPTNSDWQALQTNVYTNSTWGKTGLKLANGGKRTMNYEYNGPGNEAGTPKLELQGVNGKYWSSSTSNVHQSLAFITDNIDATTSRIITYGRAEGLSVRCIKD